MSDENSTKDKGTSGSFSLESILAEYKGAAFINNEKMTPPEILQEKADRILREAAEKSASARQHSIADEKPDTVTQPDAPEMTIAKPDKTEAMDTSFDIPDFDELPDESEPPMIITPLEEEQPEESSASRAMPFDYSDTNDDPTIVLPKGTAQLPPQPERQSDDKDNTVLFLEKYRAQASQAQDQDTIVHDVEKAIEREFGSVDEPRERSKWGFGRGSRSTVFNQDTLLGDEELKHETGEDFLEEPSLRDAAGRFARACNSISLRCIPASIITMIMVIMTYAYEAGMLVPFGIGHELALAAGALILCQLIVMMLCADVIVRGVSFLVHGAPNAETLILFSCVFSLISATFTMLSDTAAMLPFCAVSALSLLFAAYGEKYNLRAITETLKTAVGSSEPFGVQAEYNAELNKSVMKKTYNRTDGFYNNLMQPDITELIYRYATPVLLVAALLLSVLIVLIKGGVENSLHILSALLAAAAPFSLLLSFSLPFNTVVKSIRKSGAAVAGWGGADDICFTDGVCVTDDDLFPPGMLKLSGVKVYDGASPEKAIRYTASLIMKSGSGLTGLFTEVLKQQGLIAINVEDFDCHESGIGALIHGEHVSTGSAAFMNLLGVRVPDDTNMKNAVYTAVNGRLIAMFAIDYKPLPSVQSALIAMLKWRIDLFFAMRDFNVTPSMVGQKFKVPFESFVFIPAKDSYSISDLYSGKQGRMASVLIREGLSPFAEAITGGRLLRSAALFATVLSVASAALGVLIMFFMCWSGSFQSASPGNLVIFMLCMLATVLIVCGYVKLRK
jgi:hypothetical protein